MLGEDIVDDNVQTLHAEEYYQRSDYHEVVTIFVYPYAESGNVPRNNVGCLDMKPASKAASRYISVKNAKYLDDSPSNAIMNTYTGSYRGMNI